MDHRLELEHRVALVTGGSRGIGKAIALALARAGAEVAIGYRERRGDADDVVREIEGIGGRAVAAAGDIRDEVHVERVVAEVTRTLGAVDVLVANAGVARPVPLEQLDTALWDETIAVNLRSAFLLSAAVVPAMRQRRWGRLLYLSSVAAHVGGIIGPHYAASKAGLLGLMHAYASLLAKDGITANAISPALVETEMIAGNPLARPERMPVGRLGTSEEVASLAVAVIANGYVTGQTIHVNGGMYPT